jgi:hypothetical protein
MPGVLEACRAPLLDVDRCCWMTWAPSLFIPDVFTAAGAPGCQGKTRSRQHSRPATTSTMSTITANTTEDVVAIEHERQFGCAHWLGLRGDES